MDEGIGVIVLIVAVILTVVWLFENILLPIAIMLFQLIEFMVVSAIREAHVNVPR